MDVVTIDFAVALRRRREGARLTQEELAVRAGVSARSVRRIEGGHVRYPRPETARLLGRALGLSDGNLDEFVADSRVRYWQARA